MTCNSTCPNGKYGDKCENTCQCEGSSCDQISGMCMCRRGMEGLQCEYPCLPGFYGIECKEKCLETDSDGK